GDNPAYPHPKALSHEEGGASKHGPENRNREASGRKSAIETELAQWQRFALNRLGQAGGRAFEVRAIPDELAFEVSAGLMFARDRESVKRVFAGVGE
ncbi:MAG: hypothetical protein OXE95_00540, partial [Chloroflexi bacterium]|nr:hypothetical protein [Chloroflexota bacterium]